MTKVSRLICEWKEGHSLERSLWLELPGIFKILSASNEAMGCAAGLPVEPLDANGQLRPLGPEGHTFGPMCRKAGKVRKTLKCESSWDSATWNRDVPKGVPIKPNRILHERHLKIMNRFRKEVEVAPETFSDIISARRQTSADS